jgi:hypothetical protein
VSEGELLAAAESVLTSLAVALRPGRRRAPQQKAGEGRRSLEVLASSARAARFRIEKSTLVRARDNRLLARAVRGYLRRTSAF